MIHVSIQTHNRNIKAIFCTGHAGYAEAGEDIVCSAVSFLLINTANSIEKFTDSFLGSDEDDGVLSLVLKDDLDEKALVLLDSLILGLTTVQNEYGNEYLVVEYKEV